MIDHTAMPGHETKAMQALREEITALQAQYAEQREAQQRKEWASFLTAERKKGADRVERRYSRLAAAEGRAMDDLVAGYAPRP